MKYLVIFLVVVLAFLIICGGAGLLAYTWFTTSSSATLPPAPVDLPLLPTPTLVNDGNGPVTLPPVVATPAQATPGLPTPAAPFNGTFLGTLTAGNGTTAPVTLALTQDGTAVSGDIAIGDGLSLDGGSCGAQPVPAGTQRASGQTDPANPNHLDAGATFIVQGFTITLDLDADLSVDGRAMSAVATIDLPFPCNDPLITGSFVRQ
jgi:hypothetical protein